MDGVKNGMEADIDCSGGCPSLCDPGKSCTSHYDCTSYVCSGPGGGKTCAEPTCNDGVKNGTETDYDCGGGCPLGCLPYWSCLVDADCKGHLCDPTTLTCLPTCSDGIQNESETDIDCGGTCPDRCPPGYHCMIDADCLPGYTCILGHCM